MPELPQTHRPAGWKSPRERRQRADRERGSAKERGYDATWRRLRERKLTADPYCQCDACKASGAVVLATVVDHIVPIAERPDLRLVWSNLRSMAKAHHDAHTARTVGFGRRRAAPI
jgi:5-methylcytosine-specific restriction protein A